MISTDVVKYLQTPLIHGGYHIDRVHQHDIHRSISCIVWSRTFAFKVVLIDFVHDRQPGIRLPTACPEAQVANWPTDSCESSFRRYIQQCKWSLGLLPLEDEPHVKQIWSLNRIILFKCVAYCKLLCFLAVVVCEIPGCKYNWGYLTGQKPLTENF